MMNSEKFKDGKIQWKIGKFRLLSDKCIIIYQSYYRVQIMI